MGQITIQDVQYNSAGSEGKRDITATFSTSYNNTGSESTTGDSIRAVDVGLFNITRIDIPNVDGYLFRALYNTGSALTLPATARIQVFEGTSGAPVFVGDDLPDHDHGQQFISENSFPVVANVATLTTPPYGPIVMVYANVGGVTGAKTMVPSAIAPGAGEVAVNPITGVLTFNAGDAVTNCLVTAVSFNSALNNQTLTPSGTNTPSLNPGVEVANGTNLSVTLGPIPMTVWGY